MNRNLRLDMLTLRYLNAIESGNLVAADSILSLAETRPELRRAIDELHQGLLEETEAREPLPPSEA